MLWVHRAAQSAAGPTSSIRVTPVSSTPWWRSPSSCAASGSKPSIVSGTLRMILRNMAIRINFERLCCAMSSPAATWIRFRAFQRASAHLVAHNAAFFRT
jgi:hypothetical protein